MKLKSYIKIYSSDLNIGFCPESLATYVAHVGLALVVSEHVFLDVSCPS